MPGKSQRSRRKHSFPGKKKKGRRSPAGVVAQQQAGIQIDKPVALPRVVLPAVSTPAPLSVLTPLRHPYILTELRRTGILAGIMLVILVVLALVFS